MVALSITACHYRNTDFLVEPEQIRTADLSPRGERSSGKATGPITSILSRRNVQSSVADVFSVVYRQWVAVDSRIASTTLAAGRASCDLLQQPRGYEVVAVACGAGLEHDGVLDIINASDLPSDSRKVPRYPPDAILPRRLPDPATASLSLFNEPQRQPPSALRAPIARESRIINGCVGIAQAYVELGASAIRRHPSTCVEEARYTGSPDWF